MRQILFWLMLSGLAPLTRAWLVNRRSSLSHAVGWMLLAWLGWLTAWWIGTSVDPADHQATLSYVALCLACCPGIAALGARRPGVAAWNLVVLGMLAVMLWPLLEGAIIGRVALPMIHLIFMAAVLGVAVVNYVPTRMALAVLLAGAGVAAEWLALTFALAETGGIFAVFCIAAAPWLAYFTWPERATATDFDQQWLDFRDRFGLAWGQRVREQFNRAASNAGCNVVLTWHGLRSLSPTPLDETTRQEMLLILAGLLQRFRE